MAKLTIDIPDELISEFADFMAETHNYQEQVQDPNSPDKIPNPETKVQFAKRMLRNNLRQNFMRWRRDKFYKENIAQFDADITVS